MGKNLIALGLIIAAVPLLISLGSSRPEEQKNGNPPTTRSRYAFDIGEPGSTVRYDSQCSFNSQSRELE